MNFRGMSSEIDELYSAGFGDNRLPRHVRRNPFFTFANEIGRHVALLAASTETIEQDLDHLLIRVRDDVERPVFLTP